LSEIELDDSAKAELVVKIKKYFDEELQQELGGFEAQFLLEFFSAQMGCYYYNQGLADGLKTFENKMKDVEEGIFELEKAPLTSK
jgi:uncharacterized protein (DUF2164 family)